MVWLTRDGWLLLAAKTIRSCGYGLLGVVLGLYLEQAGYGLQAVGAVLTAALLGSALLTALMAARADRLGRRRTLMIATGLMFVSGLIFGLAQNVWFLIICLSFLSEKIELVSVAPRFADAPQGRSYESPIHNPTGALRSLQSLYPSRSIIAKLSALFALDALGGGFVVQSLVAYWFSLKFGAGSEVLGPVFFGANLLKAVPNSSSRRRR